jgi:hypothetical protein
VKNQFLSIVLFFALNISLSAQRINIGIFVGKDFYSIKELNTSFNLYDLTKAEINRKSFSDPLIAGLDFEVNLNKNYRVELFAEAAYLKYNITYSRNYPELLNPFNIKTSVYSIDWARANFGVSIISSFINFRNIELSGGGGINYSIIAPVVSDKFLYETLRDKFVELDVSNDIKLKGSIGGHLQANLGYNIKPLNLIPSIELKYLFTSEGRYEEPSKFFTLKIKVLYSF